MNSINMRMKREAEIQPKKRKRKNAASYPEVMSVIETRFCSLPPFCKTNIYKIKKKI
jgi:hypothetical protein